MKFPEGLPPTTVANLEQMHVTFPPGTNPAEVVAVHPTQLYETALLLLVFWWLWRRRDHRHGTGWLFGMYLVLGGAERFLVEFVRAKDDRVFGPLSLAQLTRDRKSTRLNSSHGYISYAVFCLKKKKKKKQRKK